MIEQEIEAYFIYWYNNQNKLNYEMDLLLEFWLNNNKESLIPEVTVIEPTHPD